MGTFAHTLRTRSHRHTNPRATGPPVELDQSSWHSIRRPSDLDISSLGVIDNLVARDYVSADANCGLEMVTRQGVLYVWTFRDQLNLSLVYNEAYLVNLVKSDFFQQLGIV